MKALLCSALVLTAVAGALAQSEKTEIKRKLPSPEELKALPPAEREVKLKEIRKEQEKQQGVTPEARMQRIQDHQNEIEKRRLELVDKKAKGQTLTAQEASTLKEIERRATEREKEEIKRGIRPARSTEKGPPRETPPTQSR